MSKTNKSKVSFVSVSKKQTKKQVVTLPSVLRNMVESRTEENVRVLSELLGITPNIFNFASDIKGMRKACLANHPYISTQDEAKVFCKKVSVWYSIPSLKEIVKGYYFDITEDYINVIHDSAKAKVQKTAQKVVLLDTCYDAKGKVISEPVTLYTRKSFADGTEIFTESKNQLFKDVTKDATQEQEQDATQDAKTEPLCIEYKGTQEQDATQDEAKIQDAEIIAEIA